MAEAITIKQDRSTNQDTHQDILTIAVNYVHAGLSVIPVKGNSYSRGETVDDRLKDTKTPLIPWAEYQRRLPTDDELREWFTRWPEANIAIVTGKVSGIVVIDFDSQEAIDWAKSKGILETAIVSTGRGLHAYYKYPEGKHIRNSVRINDMDIDIRADGGYCIAPPSIHLTGYIYNWQKPLNNIAEIPDSFLEVNNLTRRVVPINLRGLYNGVKRGSRNHTLARLCGSWVNDGLSYEECVEMAKTWNQNNNPPLSEEEIERTIKSIIRRHLLNDNTKQTFYHERNLLHLPLVSRIKSKVHQKEKIYYTFENAKFKKEWSVIPSVEWGLPGPFDEAVFMAINKIISEKPKPVSNPVDIGSLRNIVQMIGHDVSGWPMKNVKESILRLRSLTILSEMVFFDANKKKFITDAFGIFDRIIFTGEILDNEEKSKTTLIWLNGVYLKNINAGYVSQVDFETYISLKSFIARGIYRILASLIASNNLKLKISYQKLATKLQIPEEKYISSIKRQLSLAHKELIEKGIFQKIFFDEKQDRVIISYKR